MRLSSGSKRMATPLTVASALTSIMTFVGMDTSLARMMSVASLKTTERSSRLSGRP